MTSTEPHPRRVTRSAHDEAAGLPPRPAPDEAAVLPARLQPDEAAVRPTPLAADQPAGLPPRLAHDDDVRAEPTHALRSAADTRRITFGTVAWLVILAAVLGVQLSRRAWPDSITLLVVLGLLVIDLTGRLRHGSISVARTGPAIIGAAVLVGLVLFVAPRHGAVAGLAVVASGAAALAYAWPDRAGGDRVDGDLWDTQTSRTAFAWSAAWIAACLWELAMFVLGSKETDGRNRYPAASDLLDPVLNHPVVKALFVVVWLAAGVGLLARTDRR